MRIVSLLSSATEIVHELGMGDRLAAVSHECDHPAAALRLPRASRCRFDAAGLDSAAIDAEVRRCMAEFGSVYEVDVDALRAARPDVILTQGVCEVCAVPAGSVRDVAALLPTRPEVVSLDAHTLDEILASVVHVAEAVGEPRRGTDAVARLRGRLERVARAVAGRPRPRILALEWLDPLFAPGHWVPEMVERAGGASLLGTAGARSVEVPWERAAGLDPDRLLLVPCGYDLARARADAERARPRLTECAPRAIATGGAAVADAAFFTRSGPRVVDGVEALAAWLHPGAVDAGAAAGRVEEWR
jgi:iron complex transport system substrate-binding protein